MAVLPAIDEALMASVSRDLQVLRSDVCVIRRPVTTRDAGGAPVEGWTVSGPVDCRLAVAGTIAIERIMGARFSADADYIVSLPHGTDINDNDEVDVRGITIAVTHVPAVTYEFERTVACRATG